MEWKSAFEPTFSKKSFPSITSEMNRVVVKLVKYLEKCLIYKKFFHPVLKLICYNRFVSKQGFNGPMGPNVSVKVNLSGNWFKSSIIWPVNNALLKEARILFDWIPLHWIGGRKEIISSIGCNIWTVKRRMFCWIDRMEIYFHRNTSSKTNIESGHRFYKIAIFNWSGHRCTKKITKSNYQSKSHFPYFLSHFIFKFWIFPLPADQSVSTLDMFTIIHCHCESLPLWFFVSFKKSLNISIFVGRSYISISNI